MRKSVLVINTPKYCALCVLRSGVHHPFCRVNNRDITDLSIRPDWCPLMVCQRKTMEIIHLIHLMQDLQRAGISVLMRLQEEMQMIDLRNTCVLVRTKEENEMLLKEAEKQGFQWPTKNHCRPLPKQHFPDILKFYEDKDVTREAHIGPDLTFYEASELLGTKEMTSREFAERIADVSNCCERECIGCVLDNRNNKCNTDLCNTRNWENNIDELLEIAKVGKGTVPTPE